LGQIFQGNGRTRVTIAGKQGLTVKFQLPGIQLKLFGSCFGDFLDQVLSSLYHGGAGEKGGGRGIGPGIVGGMVRIYLGYDDARKIAVQDFCRHLGQDGIAARAHVGGSDHQCVKPVILKADFHRSRINIGDTGALHGNGRP